MLDSSAIFQRTHSGREEIYHKSAGLTQSERLVLIMIDGVTDYAGVRAKLPVLRTERFERAVLRLQQKELICPVLLPVPSAAPEELERTVIDRFLQQDPLDPVTVMMPADAEELAEFHAADAERGVAPSLGTAAQQSPEAETGRVPLLDDAHIQMFDALAEELKERAQRESLRVVKFADLTAQEKTSAVSRRPGRVEQHWGYWTCGLGFAFLAGFCVAKLIA